jgi:hypothetical protein
MQCRHHSSHALLHTVTRRNVLVQYSKGFGTTNSGYTGKQAGTKGTAKTPQQVGFH